MLGMGASSAGCVCHISHNNAVETDDHEIHQRFHWYPIPEDRTFILQKQEEITTLPKPLALFYALFPPQQRGESI
jgi:hypothetical protein